MLSEQRMIRHGSYYTLGPEVNTHLMRLPSEHEVRQRPATSTTDDSIGQVLALMLNNRQVAGY